MAQTKVLGNDGASVLAVDPTFLAARIAARPLEYAGYGRVLGHYAVAQRSGTIVNSTLGALGHVASIRNPDPSAFVVLRRIKVGWSVMTAISIGLEINFRAIIARGFSVDFTTASTAISMAGVPNTNKMRATMGTSIMGVNGPRISTTVVMSGQTLTADAAPFAIALLGNGLQPVSATGTASLVPVGYSTPMADLYNVSDGYAHPVVLSSNEGVIVQPILALPADGAIALHTVWEWAEVVVF